MNSKKSKEKYRKARKAKKGKEKQDQEKQEEQRKANKWYIFSIFISGKNVPLEEKFSKNFCFSRTASAWLAVKNPRILLPQANFHFCKEKKMLRQTFHLMKVLQLHSDF